MTTCVEKQLWSAMLTLLSVVVVLTRIRIGVAQAILETENKADTGVAFNVFNHSVLFCESAHLCGECQRPISDLTSEGTYQNKATACGCDDLCAFFNDCCYDMKASCAIQNPHRDSFFRSLTERQVVREHITCVRPNSDGKRTQGVWMVSSCPDTMRNSEASRKCQEYSESESAMYDTVPVTDNLGLTYKNVHCGICHGVSTTDLTLWNIQAHCDERTSTILNDSVDNNSTFLEIIQLLSKNCSLSFSSPEDVGPLGNRSCVQEVELEKCHEDISEDIFDICKKYTAYILDRDADDQTDSSLEGHHNPHCFICEHGYPYNVMNCDLDIPVVQAIQGPFRPRPPRGPTIVPISVLVNFNPNGFVSVSVDETVVRQRIIQCPEGAVFDPFSDICRFLSCPVGSHLFQDVCIPLAESTGCAIDDLLLGIIVGVNRSTYTTYNDDSLLQRDVERCLANLFKITILDTSAPWIFPRNSSWLDGVEEIRRQGNVAQFHFRIESDSDSIIDLLAVFDDVLPSTNNGILSDEICGVVAATISQMCVSLTNCSEMNVDSEFSFVTRNDASFVFSNVTNKFYDISQPQLYITYSRQHSKQVIFRKVQHAIICDNPLDCPLITFNASEFKFVTNASGTLVHTPSGIVFQTDEYQMASDGSIQVCSFLNNTGIENFTDVISFVAYSEPQVIVTLVGYITSIVGEIVTFVTYCMFRPLRNRTSYAIMNLVVALLLGQVLLLVGGGRTEPTQLCTTIAILLHYFFLSTFSWSTVLSYDLYRIFGAESAPVRVDGSRKMLVIHMTYAWCCPLLVIIPCIIIHFCNCTKLSFQYGSSMSCWINSEFANFVVFGIPILVALLFNIYYFCRTVWGIHISKRGTSSRAPPSETARKKKYQELMIYAKIASLMGFTWIFAFIAAFTGMEVFWYIYIVLNSFQGLYIFLAFIANSMVWGLWKKKLPNRCSNSDGSIQSTKSTRKRSGGGDRSGPVVDGDMNNITRRLPTEISNKKQITTIPSDTQI
ncbi:uncharacterized protein [Amphiura filiformis]|uniref:uncharacterized protein n=1 Tax=Amphiura filiformis TaxID=82378 RepID=UPI003B215EFF